jgi:hypothetical protein
VAICADQDLHPRPVAADGPYQAAEEAKGLSPTRPLRQAQHGDDGATLAVEHEVRLEAALVVADG